MEAAEIYALVRARFPDQVVEIVEKRADPYAVVDPNAIVAICGFMRDDAALAMDCLNNQSGVDYKDRIEVVYHLFSYSHRHGAVIKVRLPRDNPALASVEPVWNSANWMEREIFDLLGVTFHGHSDMRRILMPEDWPGWPLRKDFVEPLEYHGISTVRESPIIRLDEKKK
jgi:NADH-quinone oxidoreductase subunit C